MVTASGLNRDLIIEYFRRCPRLRGEVRTEQHELDEAGDGLGQDGLQHVLPQQLQRPARRQLEEHDLAERLLRIGVDTGGGVGELSGRQRGRSTVGQPRNTHRREQSRCQPISGGASSTHRWRQGEGG